MKQHHGMLTAREEKSVPGAVWQEGQRSPVNTKIATSRSTITITCRLFCFQCSFRNFTEISTRLMENNGGDVASGKLHLYFLLWYFCQAVQQLIPFSNYLMFILSVLIVAGTTPCQHFPNQPQNYTEQSFLIWKVLRCHTVAGDSALDLGLTPWWIFAWPG